MFGKTYRIVLAGGGTGGHLFPLVSVAKKIQELLNSEVEFLYIGPSGDLEKKIIGEGGIASARIFCGKWRRYFDVRNLFDAFKNIFGFFQSLWHLYWFMPDAVFSKGSYAAVPVVLAAWVYRIPILTQDSDAIPGVANKIMGTLANRVAVAYPSASKYFESRKVAIIGNPEREGILLGDIERAKIRFKNMSGKPTLLVLGGSLGSKSVNHAVLRAFPKLLDRFFIIHQTGSKNYDECEKYIKEFHMGDADGRYALVPFLDVGELSDALALSDIIVSRAGANAITDIAAVGKPSILVPLPSAANDEQRMNAYEIARIGGALVLEEPNLGENILLEKINFLMDSEELRKKMSESIRLFHRPDATTKLAEGVIDLMRMRG